MKHDLDKFHRRSVRLPGHDYSLSGAYFLTICTFQREYLFGDVIRGKMILSDAGKIIQKEWLHSFDIRRELEEDAFVIMPNHFHAIVWIIVGANGVRPDPGPQSLPHNPGAQSLPASLKPPSDRFSDHSNDVPPSMESIPSDHASDGILGMAVRDQGERRSPLQHHMRPQSISSLMSGFKAATQRQINILRSVEGLPVWQRNYHDRIIRTDLELFNIRQYIANNPAKWDEDLENVKRNV